MKANFDVFAKEVQKQFALMAAMGTLVRTDVDPDALWEHYLASFPAGTNNIFRERREYDCTCCKQFIRNIGNVVALTATGMISIWDIVDTVEGYHRDVVEAMSAKVKSGKIVDYYLSEEKSVGTQQNRDSKLSDIVWKHFYTPIPKEFQGNATKLGEMRTTREMFQRGLDDYTQDALDTVLELIEQGSLYRGEEHNVNVLKFKLLKQIYDIGSDLAGKERWVWISAKSLGMSARFRGTVISTLIEDISKGVELDKAVASFEAKVAPHNYKRPTAIVTAKQIQNAADTIKELGLQEALYRRFAKPTDISNANVLFSAAVNKPLDIMDELLTDANAQPSKKILSKTEEISIAKFLSDVLPLASSIELLMENRLCNNLMSVIAPIHPNDTKMFKWNNGFSYAYTGDIADSIQERVKAAGGAIEGDLRASLAWYNYDDLDLHAHIDSEHIYFGDPTGRFSQGKLDVDMNRSAGGSRQAVENIVWKHHERIPEDQPIHIEVKNFNRREAADVGFSVQMAFNGKIVNLTHKKMLNDRQTVRVCSVVRKGSQFEIVFMNPDVVCSESSREIWGLKTEQFVPVTMILPSPNCWDGEAVGNKHTFFILEGARNPDAARGFFNEFLRSDLEQHRKSFELLGSKTKAEPTAETQVSGVGFSETKRDTVTVRVSGKTKRTFKIQF